MTKLTLLLLFITVYSAESISGHATSGGGNRNNGSYSVSKKRLTKDVYTSLPKETLYCEATFEAKRITDPNGFYSDKYKRRATRMEWEHVVPAENFGRAFASWNTGNPQCVTRAGRVYKGRACATKVSQEYRYMQADMYNLYPSIGSVNALRSNYRYGMVVGNYLGECPMKINDRKAQPPEYARGIVARISLYFDKVYPKYTLSDSQRQLFESWNILYPVTKVECTRNALIETIQGNINEITAEACNTNETLEE